MLTDKEILFHLTEQIREDNMNSFREFFEIMQPGIFYFLYRLTSNTETAKDLTQETFIRFWQHRRNINPNCSAVSYLYKIARNLAINNSVKNKRVTRIDDEENALIRLSKNPHTQYDSIFFMDDYQRAIEKLPERCRAAFVLSRYSGFEYSEIAEILGISVQTVKNQMNKAFSVLKKLLAVYLN